MDPAFRVVVISIIILAAISSGCMTPSSDSAVASVASGVPSPRIVCLSSDAAELLVLIGAGEHVIGVPEALFQHQPELLPYLPNAQSVGDAIRPDNERILSLKPDIVMFVTRWRPSTADRWESAGIQLIAVDSHKAEELPRIARMFGLLTGHNEKAEAYAVFCEETVSIVGNRIDPGNTTSPRIYMESYTDYVAYGSTSAADSLIQRMNAKSVSGQVFSNATRISAEWLVQQDPDIVIRSVIPENEKTLESEYFRMMNRPGFCNTSAAKNGNVFMVNGNLIFSAAAPIGDIFVAKALYPEKFEDISPENLLSEYNELFPPGTGQQQAIYPVPWESGAHPDEICSR